MNESDKGNLAGSEANSVCGDTGRTEAHSPLPTEPTPEMVWAGNNTMSCVGATAAAVWRAMVAAHIAAVDGLSS